MAKMLWLLRHGEAEDDAPSDFERRLTARGERQAQCAGRALARIGVAFEHAFSSPRLRALATAQLACSELGVEVVVHEPLGGAFGLDDALELVNASSSEGALLLVGHEPDFSRLVYELTGARAVVKKGGLVGIRLGGRSGELAALLRPREIELAAGG
jgi:phosphohistidine phosphatase